MPPSPSAPDLEVTPAAVFRNRRRWIKSGILAGSLLATGGLYRTFRPHAQPARKGRNLLTVADLDPGIPLPPDESLTAFGDIAGYNNYYEFSTDKSRVAGKARDFVTDPWNLEVDGLVEHPLRLDLTALLGFDQVERTYRFRCVEGWSMVIPWIGFPLSRLLEQVLPAAGATHVAFETYFDRKQMPDADSAGIDLPYVEGLRLAEAMHPLTLLATGLYGETLPNQNGAPVRLVVPWKYGFKSIKSLVRITLTDREPATTWNLANPEEYGFYSNVNPAVDHPRWSQARERRIGEAGTRETLPFNGYGDEVGHLYAGMDLSKHY